MLKLKTKKWQAFEHFIWNNLKSVELDKNNQFVLAVSGGLDSMVLLEVFLKIKPRAILKVVYFHHGDTSSKKQKKFRDACATLIQKKISDFNAINITFHTEKSTKKLISEADMRKARWAFINSLNVNNQNILVTAHHLDDRLETIMLKLIRGTGVDSFDSFKMWNSKIFRPFLNQSKSDLLTYAKKNKIKWLDDPTNTDKKYLRNWLREKWFKDLNKKQSGASANLAKSLLNIASSLNVNQDFDIVTSSKPDKYALSRKWYETLESSEKLRALSLYLKKHQIHEYTNGQLVEIRKRLDKNQKDITFEILKRKWVITAEEIVIT